MLDPFHNKIKTYVVFEGYKFGNVAVRPIIIENSLIYGHLYKTIRSWCKEMKNGH